LTESDDSFVALNLFCRELKVFTLHIPDICAFTGIPDSDDFFFSPLAVLFGTHLTTDTFSRLKESVYIFRKTMHDFRCTDNSYFIQVDKYTTENLEFLPGYTKYYFCVLSMKRLMILLTNSLNSQNPLHLTFIYLIHLWGVFTCEIHVKQCENVVAWRK